MRSENSFVQHYSRRDKHQIARNVDFHQHQEVDLNVVENDRAQHEKRVYNQNHAQVQRILSAGRFSKVPAAHDSIFKSNVNVQDQPGKQHVDVLDEGDGHGLPQLGRSAGQV